MFADQHGLIGLETAGGRSRYNGAAHTVADDRLAISNMKSIVNMLILRNLDLDLFINRHYI
jgi:hypothetical protein